jgi:hydrogenase 3 maturation protease
LLNRAQKKLSRPDRDHSLRIAIIGVGSELNGDDAAGLLVVRLLGQHRLPETCLVLETGPAPENFTALVVRFAPDWVLVVDAAQLGAQPGRIAYVGSDEVAGVSAFTHGLPLALLGRYLAAETGCQFGLLGIQALDTGFGAPLSAAVQSAARRLARAVLELTTEAPSH